MRTAEIKTIMIPTISIGVIEKGGFVMMKTDTTPKRLWFQKLDKCPRSIMLWGILDILYEVPWAFIDQADLTYSPYYIHDIRIEDPDCDRCSYSIKCPKQCQTGEWCMPVKLKS